MIFRNSKGELVEINQYDFKTDAFYYEKIMEMKYPKLSFSKLGRGTKTDAGYRYSKNRIDQVILPKKT